MRRFSGMQTCSTQTDRTVWSLHPCTRNCSYLSAYFLNLDWTRRKKCKEVFAGQILRFIFTSFVFLIVLFRKAGHINQRLMGVAHPYFSAPSIREKSFSNLSVLESQIVLYFAVFKVKNNTFSFSHIFWTNINTKFKC